MLMELIGNKARKNIFLLASALLLTPFTSLFAKTCCGKIDISPTWVHLDVLESGKTVNRMNLYGLKTDLSYIFSNGFCLKPSLLMTSCQEGSLTTCSIALGYYLPLTPDIALMPTIGMGWSHISTYINLPDLGIRDVKETFRARSGIVGLEAYYTIRKGWRLSAQVNYAWSKSHTKLEKFFNSYQSCAGPSYAVMFETDISPKSSFNVGAGYNLSLSKERHGVRGYGMKVGYAYWF